MCWRCDMFDAFVRREYDARTRAALDRGRARVEQYIEQHQCSMEEAIEGLDRERRKEFADLVAVYADRHGLDDEETMFALWAHGIDGPGMVQ